MAAGDASLRGQSDFQGVYNEFHARILRYLGRMVGPREAEDVAQEVFAKVSQSLPQFRGDSSLSTWIYRIATNAACDRLRAASARRSPEEPIDNQTPVEDPSPGAEQSLVRKEMNDCIGGYIARLPASYRAVLIMSEYEGLANQEIAEALGLSLDTVKIRLHRGRARLRKELGGGCDFYRDGRNELSCEPKPKGVSRRD